MRECSEHGTNSNVCDIEGCFNEPIRYGHCNIHQPDMYIGPSYREYDDYN